ncbi:MAG TPA: molybdopterin molybdenumtransferase MoeA, partial [Nitrospirota bacterium]
MPIKDMLGRSGVVSREEALKTLEERVLTPSLSSETITISESLGRITAGDIASPADLPAFDRSTMDGYAVRSADTFGAAESRPALLAVVGDIPMGKMPAGSLGKGEAMKIATGGALPDGADAVVMLEQTQPVDEKTIEAVKPAAPDENVIRAGDDIRKGELIFGLGHRIRPQDMAALAGVGITRVSVFERPRVAIISTGNEIVPAEAVPAPGQIRDSNSYHLEGLVAQT